MSAVIFQGVPKPSLDREAVGRVAFDGWFVPQRNPRSFAKVAPFANLEMLHAELSATRTLHTVLGPTSQFVGDSPMPIARSHW
jgi:hypothetical protein